MRKKRILGGVLATAVMATAILGGCSQVSSNQSADMAQVIAEVNVAKAAALDDGLKDYAEAVGTSKVIKRDLIVYFISTGSSYITNYGWTYEQTFNQLMEGLTSNSVLVQYATLYLLREKAKESSAQTVISEYTSKTGDNEVETQIARYEYLLDEDSVNLAKYTLMYSLNGSIDRQEKENSDSSSSGTETRSTPTGVDTQKDDYYPSKIVDGKKVIDYNVYTGFDGYRLDQSGKYQSNKEYVEGTSKASRIKAYNEFLKTLASLSYNLVDTDKEDIRDIMSLTYVREEYCSQLEQRILNKYYDLYEKEQEDKIAKIVEQSYNNLLDEQKDSYGTESGISSALGNMSDSEFVLYAPDTQGEGKYGFVYNILLPFSASQSAQLTALQNKYKDEDLDGGYKPEYYVARKALLENIKTTDQRSAWFNGEKDYSFKAEGAAGTDYYGKTDGYLFFENNVKDKDRYEPIKRYDGRYAYKGTVVEKEDDYVLSPEPLTINQMLDEFMGYVEFACGKTVTKDLKQTYSDFDGTNLYKKDETDKIDYENFVYASGHVNLTNYGNEAYNRANYLKADTENYKALAAVNELQYAYTTDTGVLSQFVGYSVDVGDTSYIKEFEHVSQWAIGEGAGTWAVCAGDYGWHLIYVTYVFDNTGVPQYQNLDWENNVKVEGTFENLFYEMTKTTNISNVSTKRSTQIISKFKSDDTVTTYQSRYQDLLDMDNNN